MSFWNKITGGLKAVGGALTGGLIGGAVLGPVGTALGTFRGATSGGGPLHPFGSGYPGPTASAPGAGGGATPPNLPGIAAAPSAPGRADWTGPSGEPGIAGAPGNPQMMAGGYDPSNPLSMPGVRDYYNFGNALQGSQGQMLGGPGPASGTIAQQQGLANALNMQMQGRGPSLATNLLQQAKQQNLADALSMAGSARGLNRGQALYQAGQQASSANASADQQAAQARIQEQLGAEGLLQGTLGQMGTTQLAQQGAGTQAFGTAGGLQNQSNATDMQGHIAQGQLALGQYQANLGAQTQDYLGQLAAQTQRYGIDSSTALGRYGIDTGADTARYGIGTNYSLGTQQLAMQPYLAQMGQNFQQSVMNQQMNAAQHTGGLLGMGGFLGTGLNLSEGGEVPGAEDDADATTVAGYDDGGFVSDYGAEEEPGTAGASSIPGSASASAGGSDNPLATLANLSSILGKTFGASQNQGASMGGGSLAGAGVGGPGDPQVVNPNYNPYQGASDKGTSNLLGLAMTILPFLSHGGEVPGPVPEAKTMDDKDYKPHGKNSNGKEKTEAPPSGQSGGEVPGYAKGGYTGLVSGQAPNPTMPAPMAGMSALPSVAPLIPKPTGPLDMIANALPILATLLPGNLGMIAGPVSSILANQFGIGDPSATNLGMYAPLLMMMKRKQAAQQQRDAIDKIVKQNSNSTYTGEPGDNSGGPYASDKIAAQPDEANYPSGAAETAGDAHGGEIEEEDGRDGGHVPGKAKVSGDSGQNDTVPAMLSPGEIVIPRSIAQHPDAPNLAADFVAQIRAKKGEPSGYGKVVAAKERAARGG